MLYACLQQGHHDISTECAAFTLLSAVAYRGFDRHVVRFHLAWTPQHPCGLSVVDILHDGTEDQYATRLLFFGPWGLSAAGASLCVGMYVCCR